jgi:uncharacterized membrane protein
LAGAGQARFSGSMMDYGIDDDFAKSVAETEVTVAAISALFASLFLCQ